MGTGDAKLRRIIDIASEAQMVNGCAGWTVIELPSGFAERFKRETASVNDSAKLGKKDDLLALLERVRNQTCDWVGRFRRRRWRSRRRKCFARLSRRLGMWRNSSSRISGCTWGR